MLALCIYYDNEMCQEIADNFWEACESGKKDDYVKNDEKYFLLIQI